MSHDPVEHGTTRDTEDFGDLISKEDWTNPNYVPQVPTASEAETTSGSTQAPSHQGPTFGSGGSGTYKRPHSPEGGPMETGGGLTDERSRDSLTSLGKRQRVGTGDPKGISAPEKSLSPTPVPESHDNGGSSGSVAASQVHWL
ncbi:hypothetical protein QFC21_006696 [Naganishia friedmannii]|uniref:Uncharacterized protein n=1 Tax=Naganishia friedmannii TaxID=89922 RepID=A0ACC2V1L7_9TREE|nr:hypothetical protein QFC21_006696 [Naganishia friedmannii]